MNSGAASKACSAPRRVAGALLLALVAAVSAVGCARETTTVRQPDVTLDPPARTDPAALRSQLTAFVMVPRGWVVSRPEALAPEIRAILENPDVGELVRDGRGAPGGTVRENPDEVVRSRAIGLKGLVVSLTNRRDRPAAVTVATAALGLSGTIHGVDAWTGRGFESRDGRLGGLIGARDSVLIRIV